MWGPWSRPLSLNCSHVQIRHTLMYVMLWRGKKKKRPLPPPHPKWTCLSHASDKLLISDCLKERMNCTPAYLVINDMAGGCKSNIHFAVWEFYITAWVFYCALEKPQKYIPVVRSLCSLSYPLQSTELLADLSQHAEHRCWNHHCHTALWGHFLKSDLVQSWDYRCACGERFITRVLRFSRSEARRGNCVHRVSLRL